MAIKKIKSVLGGQLDAEYWKLVQINYNALDKSVSLILALFKDEEAASSSAPLLEQKSFYFNITDEESVGNLKAFGYTKIKAYAEEIVEGVPRETDLAGGEDV